MEENKKVSKKRKVTYRPDLVEDGIELSVSHLKQFFKFGHGNTYLKTKAVHDVSFDIKKGECFGLVGESGCGKTTTGRSLIRLYNITSGSIYFKGYRISGGTRWNEKEIKWKKIYFKNETRELHNEMLNEIYKITDITGIRMQIKNINNEIDKNIDELSKAKTLYKERLKKASLANNEDDLVSLKQSAIHDFKASSKPLKDQILALKERRKILVNEDKLARKNIDKVNIVENKRQVEAIKDKYNELFAANKKAIKEIVVEQKKVIKQIKYDNRHVDKKLMAKMQMIFQDPVDSLDPRMTVEDIIQEGLHIQGQHNPYANRKKVKEVLEKVGLLPEYASRYPHEFSGGQRQRIGIARALIMNPDFLICDEPISALDVSIRAQIINLLNDLKEEMGLTILFIAHDLSVVKYFCDRIAVMYYGEIVEMASSDELFKHPLHPYTHALLSAIPKPDPISEKKRKRFVYDPSKEHDYSRESPKLTEIVPGHFVLANSAELEKYKKQLKED